MIKMKPIHDFFETLQYTEARVTDLRRGKKALTETPEETEVVLCVTENGCFTATFSIRVPADFALPYLKEALTKVESELVILYAQLDRLGIPVEGKVDV